MRIRNEKIRRAVKVEQFGGFEVVVVGVKTEEAGVWVRWIRMIRCGDPLRQVSNPRPAGQRWP